MVFYYVTFKKILLKIEREPQYYQETCISFGSFVVGKVFAKKEKLRLLQKKTIKKWKQEISWLLFTKAQKLVCVVCTSQKEIIQSSRNYINIFIVGSTNYRLSSMQDHKNSESHQEAVPEEEHDKALKEGISVPLRKIVHNVPADSAISLGLQNMGKKEKQTVEKLHEMAFYLVLEGHPFTDSRDQVKLEKLHGVKYTGPYENESACSNFTFCISEYFLGKT